MQAERSEDIFDGRRSKIVCTLGPSTDAEGVLGQLIAHGMDAARLNFNYGEVGQHLARIEILQRLRAQDRRPISLIVDLPGRKVRVGALEGDCVRLETGRAVALVADDGRLGNSSVIPVNEWFFSEHMAGGDKHLLSEGLVELRTTAVKGDHVEAVVVQGGLVTQRTALHTPGMPLRGDPLTDRDLEILKAAVEYEVDYVALSYIADAADILVARERLAELGSNIPLIAKIERPEAIARFDGILRRADAVMIRRGDLGAEIEVTRIPLVQKRMLRLANEAGVPVIIATQMLSSMLESPRPTRAEASDVSNAIFDGADGVLLSAETAIGKYPKEAASMMNRIIVATERERRLESATTPPARQARSGFADAVAGVACRAAVKAGARLIACFTESGRTAQLVAKYRPQVPILAFCSNERTRRRLTLHWGIRSDGLGPISDVEDMIRRVEARLVERRLVRRGDRIVVVFGAPMGQLGSTNSVRLHEIGTNPSRAKPVDVAAQPD
ncbi:MAG: pyruvate kinase [Deltaproteobacteria bacterium]|nr:pyruvate kinase [Deltaproteobacteria bacterium]